jgi:ElaA protein
VILRSGRFADLDPATLYALLRLRCDVFVVEQRCPYPELDGRDLEPGTTHCWIEHDDAPVAYLRVLREPGAARIGRVCTAKAHRGIGLAGRLIQAALDALEPGTRCVLDAQTDAIRLYERLGFVTCGDKYVEDGIEHVPMIRA